MTSAMMSPSGASASAARSGSANCACVIEIRTWQHAGRLAGFLNIVGFICGGWELFIMYCDYWFQKMSVQEEAGNG